jgi:hypothetical protein
MRFERLDPRPMLQNARRLAFRRRDRVRHTRPIARPLDS